MKKLIAVFGILFLLSSFYQINDVKKSQNDLEIKCKEVKVSTDKNILEYTGDVSFKTEIFELKSADKVIYNRSTNELEIFGWTGFTIDGGIIANNRVENKLLKYTLGQKVAYLE